MKNKLFKKALITALLSTAFLQPLFAQLENVVIDSVHTPYAATVAVNAKDLKNIVAGAGSNALFFSIDEGQTWQASAIAPKPSSASNAAIIADAKGNFYYFYVADTSDASRIVMQFSEDGGKTWELNDGLDLSLQNYSHICPSIDMKNNLYLTWTQLGKGNDADCQSNIFLSKSTNKGKKWSEPIMLSQTQGDCSGKAKTLSSSASATVGLDKNFAAWMNDGQIIMDRAYDGKVWLNNDILIANVGTGHIEIPGFNDENGLPMFISDNGKSFFGGSLYLITTKKQKNDDVDVLFLRSHNGGDNWTTPMGFADDEPGTLQFKPAMAIDQETGCIYIVYYNQPRTDSDATDVFIAYSNDGGGSFKKRKINAKSFIPTKNNISGSYIGITANKGVIIPVWTEISNGKARIQTVTFKQADFWKK
jgi:hypothetical protein